MATRRRLPLMGYGAGNVPATRGGVSSALPPPPDGTIPNRLPVGVDPNAAPVDPNMQQMQGEGSGGDSNADPLQMMLRLLEQANKGR